MKLAIFYVKEVKTVGIFSSKSKETIAPASSGNMGKFSWNGHKEHTETLQGWGKNGYPPKRPFLKIKKLRVKMGIASGSLKPGLSKYLQMLSSGFAWDAHRGKSCSGNSSQVWSPHHVRILWESRRTLWDLCLESHTTSRQCKVLRNFSYYPHH